ncbi:unnamed protein product [Taenia asiatica]|uniref:Secreted protein n=1 Tax=Taenia asiatica TaxID=60517 RepID=A0A0R3W727_TAEAS|nr:unnamed protein product [Taenia asiatica]
MFLIPSLLNGLSNFELLTSEVIFSMRSHQQHKKTEQSCDYAFCETSGVYSTPFLKFVIFSSIDPPLRPTFEVLVRGSADT